MYNYKRIVFNDEGVRTYQSKDDNRIFISIADMLNVCKCTSFRTYASQDKDYILISKSEANGQGFYNNRGTQMMSCIPINGIQRIAKTHNMNKESKDAMLACTEYCVNCWLNPNDITEKSKTDTSVTVRNDNITVSNEELSVVKLNGIIEAQKKRMNEMEAEFNALREENAEISRRFNEVSEENEELSRRIDNCTNGVCEGNDLDSIISVLEYKLNEAKLAARKYEEVIGIIKGMM